MVIWDSNLRMSGLYRKNRVLLANSTSSGSDCTTAGGGFSALFRSACARDNSFFSVAISLSKMDLAGKLSRMSSVCFNPSPKIVTNPDLDHHPKQIWWKIVENIKCGFSTTNQSSYLETSCTSCTCRMSSSACLCSARASLLPRSRAATPSISLQIR